MFEMKDGYIEFTRKVYSCKGKRYVDYILNTESVPVAKRCTVCGVMKLLDAYCKRSSSKFDGRQAKCKECNKSHLKDWRKENKEHLQEYGKQYHEANREHRLEQMKQWREANTEHTHQYYQQYYQENKEHLQDYWQYWYKNNPDKVLVNSQRRRTKQNNLPDTLSVEDRKVLLEIQNRKCILSGKSSDLHFEHFIPISWCAGGTTFENCYYMERSLNISKWNRNPFEWIKRQPEAYQHRFHTVLVPMLAERNGMTIQAFIEYVYECEKAYIEQKALV